MKASIASRTHRHIQLLRPYLRKSRTCRLKVQSKCTIAGLTLWKPIMQTLVSNLTVSIPYRPVLAVSDARRTADGSQKGPIAPSSFYCPISMELMNDPVMVATGHTYDRVCIERWLQQGNRTCPVTGMRLRHLELTPNFALRNAIQVQHTLSWQAQLQC